MHLVIYELNCSLEILEIGIHINSCQFGEILRQFSYHTMKFDKNSPSEKYLLYHTLNIDQGLSGCQLDSGKCLWCEKTFDTLGTAWSVWESGPAMCCRPHCVHPVVCWNTKVLWSVWNTWECWSVKSCYVSDTSCPSRVVSPLAVAPSGSLSRRRSKKQFLYYSVQGALKHCHCYFWAQTTFN